MRLELLLTGQLVFTDAQFYDGLYFHWLAQDTDELRAFEKMMVDFSATRKGRINPFSIMVKCRTPDGDKDHEYTIAPDLAQIAVNMFCKEFQFSSVEDDKLVEAVFDLGKDYSDKYLGSPKEAEWIALLHAIEVIRERLADYLERLGFSAEEINILEKAIGSNSRKVRSQILNEEIPIRSAQEDGVVDINTYVSNMKRLLEAYYGNESSLVENWEKYASGLQTLFRIKKINKWGFWNTSDKWECPDWRGLNSKCLSQSIPVKAGETYLNYMKALLTEAEGPKGMDENPASKRYFACITDELNRGITNRSKITMALGKLEHINSANQKNSEREYANERFLQFRQLLNERYNKVLACQHGCDFLDLCDYTKIFEWIEQKKIPVVTIKLPNELVTCLAELSWKDFAETINTGKTGIHCAFESWMQNCKGFELKQKEKVQQALESYLSKLAEHFQGPVSSLNNEGPWNIENTCDEAIRNIFAQFYQFPYFLVGGGSYEPGIRRNDAADAAEEIEGNEISILCAENANEPDKVIVFRLHMDPDTVGSDYNFNTLLAPVSNPLNGGAL